MQPRVNPAIVRSLGAGWRGPSGLQSAGYIARLYRTIRDGFIVCRLIGKGEAESLDVRGAFARELHVIDGLFEFPT